MPFRANEEEQNGYQSAVAHLLGRHLSAQARGSGLAALNEIIERHGPVVSGYPSWHPLVSACNDGGSPPLVPGDRCGYRRLDHTVYLRNAFITCPYGGADEVIASVNEIAARDLTPGVAALSAERLAVTFYHEDAEPVLVACNWQRPMATDGSIPASVAVPLFLLRELPGWQLAQVAETWETMAVHAMGSPHGRRSSLFVNGKTGQAMKSIWSKLIETGLYGPVQAKAKRAEA